MMKLRRSILRGLLPAAAVLLAIAAVVVSSEGLPSFSMTANPTAAQTVQFRDTSSGLSPMGWLWEFGDGRSSTLQNPTHVYEAAGWYPVTLRVSSLSGTTQTTAMVEVVQAGTLRLLSQAGHAFDVTLEARDPRTGNTGVGEAIPQNDVFGYFTIPALVPTNPGAPLVPEVFVKMLDARPIGQDFWVFWGGLTDLEYTLTIRDTVTGATKVKHNPVTDSQVCLGADTGGFAGTTQTTAMVEVVQAGTLRLLSQAGRAFDVTLEARDPRTGNTGVGEAIPQNDVFGYFTIPALVPTNPGAPLVPEVFVKMLDARPIGQGFWVFWGGLTDLEYTLTIRDTVTGATKIKHNPVTDSQVCLGADTGGFASLATPTPMPTPTPTPTPPPGAVRIVNVGQGGNLFVDAQSGGRQTTISVGQTVQWNWMGSPHSSTSGACEPGDPYDGGGGSCDDDGLWDSGAQSVPFQYPRTFTAPGTYNYYCNVHGAAMTGVVVVQAP